MNYWFIILPLSGALIGWLSIRLSAWLIFHPHQPWKIAGITLQGAFPRKQQQLAERLGKTVSEQFFSFDAIESKITDEKHFEKLVPLIEAHIDDFLRNRLGKEMPMINMFIGDKTIAKMKEAFMKEIQAMFPQLMKQYVTQLKTEFDIQRLVTEKIAALPVETAENLVYKGMSRELKLAGFAGMLVGFLVGLVQVLIFYLLG